MPAVSRNQRIAMAIAEKDPEKLYAKDQGLLNMSHAQLHDFAATPEHDLPLRASSMPGLGKVKSQKVIGPKMPAVGRVRKYYGE